MKLVRFLTLAVSLLLIVLSATIYQTKVIGHADPGDRYASIGGILCIAGIVGIYMLILTRRPSRA